MIDNYRLKDYAKMMNSPLKTLLRSLLAAILLSVALVSSGAWAGELADANHGNPGQTLDIKSLVVKGKTTLIDFHSPYCPPCVQLAPIIAQLAAKRPDLAVKKVNINRPEVRGIDWRSPLAEQYQIRQVPFFMILNPEGKPLAQGRQAAETLERWLQEAGLMK
jgi:thiol-disulfide isomerase/thioredoxin